jgi:ketosteroid isomerase-like protein
MRVRRVALVGLLSLAVALAMQVPAAENSGSSEVEQEVWAFEEAYMAAFANANHSDIASMLHGDFLGWPRESKVPSEKSDVERFLKENFPQPLEASFTIRRMGIRVNGDVVITHYLVKINGENRNGIGQTQTVRITHTWIKEGVQWKILGGMSCTQHANKPADTGNGNA